MIKMELSDDPKEQARLAVDYLENVIKTLLNSASLFSEEDRIIVLTSLNVLRDHFSSFEVVAEKTTRIRGRALLYDSLTKLMLTSFLIGSATVLSPEADKWRQAVQAYKMRNARGGKAEVKALQDAIVAAHGTGPVPRPAKEAAAILSAVNRQLTDAGFAEVKVDVVRRALEKKFPRS